MNFFLQNNVTIITTQDSYLIINHFTGDNMDFFYCHLMSPMQPDATLRQKDGFGGF